MLPPVSENFGENDRPRKKYFAWEVTFAIQSFASPGRLKPYRLTIPIQVVTLRSFPMKDSVIRHDGSAAMYGTLGGIRLPPRRVSKSAVGVVPVMGVVEAAAGSCVWGLGTCTSTGVVVVVTDVTMTVVGCSIECSFFSNV